MHEDVWGNGVNAERNITSTNTVSLTAAFSDECKEMTESVKGNISCEIDVCRNFNVDKTTLSQIQILIMSRREDSSLFAKEEDNYKLISSQPLKKMGLNLQGNM